jgi:hypothetical protein
VRLQLFALAYNLANPVLKRTLSHGYDVNVLPAVV